MQNKADEVRVTAKNLNLGRSWYASNRVKKICLREPLLHTHQPGRI